MGMFYVPRPFFAGEEKRAWYNLFAHARDSVDIFRVLARSLPHMYNG